MKNYTVGVFPHKRKQTYLFVAYLRDYCWEWTGCNLVNVEAENGIEAKKKAVEFIRKRLLFGTPSERASVKIVED